MANVGQLWPKSGGGSGGDPGGYKGVWSNAVAYPAGSIVLHNGIEWGTSSSLTAGGVAPAPPGGTLVPTGVDMAASAPAIQILTDGENVSSAVWNPSSFTTESGEPVSQVASASYSAWLKYKPLSSGSVTFTTEGSGDTVLAMYRWTGGAAAFSFASLTLVASNDGPAWSTITYTVTAGDTYYFQIGNWGTPATYKFNLIGARRSQIESNPWQQLSAPTGMTGTLDGLSDVNAPTPALNDVLTYAPIPTTYVKGSVINITTVPITAANTQWGSTDSIRVIDGSTHRVDGVGAWVRIDFTTAVRIFSFQMNVHSSKFCPFNWQYSDNDTTWTTVDLFTPVAGQNTFTLSDPSQNHRYWRYELTGAQEEVDGFIFYAASPVVGSGNGWINKKPTMIVLAAGAPVPAGTPAGTVIVRTV